MCQAVTAESKHMRHDWRSAGCTFPSNPCSRPNKTYNNNLVRRARMPHWPLHARRAPNCTGVTPSLTASACLQHQVCVQFDRLPAPPPQPRTPTALCTVVVRPRMPGAPRHARLVSPPMPPGSVMRPLVRHPKANAHSSLLPLAPWHGLYPYPCPAPHPRPWPYIPR